MVKTVKTNLTLYRTVEEKKYWDLRNDVAIYRGKIIDETLIIEQAIDNIIAAYFCKVEKINDAFSMIFNKGHIGFLAKENILKLILSKPEYENFGKKYKTIKNDITKIRTLRNSLAHSKIYSTSENISGYDGNKLPIFKDTNGGKKEDMGFRMRELKSQIGFMNAVFKGLLELYKIIKQEQPK
ncbi:MAG TPA: hypothetical protein VJY62_12715 [Bacteroidia bacterium]|nr:hypothetical protein [Bacteroidia bacterium]